MSDTTVEQSVIPPAVKAAADRADQLQRELIASQTGATPVPAPSEQAPPPAEPAPIPAPSEQAPPPPADPSLPIQPPSFVAPPRPSPVDGFSPARTASDEEIDHVLAMTVEPNSRMAFLQHQYRSERGRRLRLRAEIETPPMPAPVHFDVPQVSDDEPIITDEDREAYGDELANFVETTARRAAERIAAREVKKVVEPLNQREQQNVERAQMTLLTSLNRAMEPAGITFQQLNTHPQFLQWLDLQDPMSGAKRLDLLQSAWAALDGSRMLTIIGAFLDGVTPPSEQPAPPPAVPPVAPAPQRQPQVDLMTLAAPGRAPQTEPALPQPAPTQKQTYTRAQIRDFYAAKARGRYTPADAKAIEKDIFDAQHENRIIG